MKKSEAKGSHCHPRWGIRRPSLGTNPLPLLLAPYVSIPHSCSPGSLTCGSGLWRWGGAAAQPRSCAPAGRSQGMHRQRADTVRDQSARAAGSVGMGTRLAVPGSAASLRPQGPRDQWLRAGPTPSRLAVGALRR